MDNKRALIIIFFIAAMFPCQTLFSQSLFAGIDGGYNVNLASQSLSSKIDNGLTETSNVLVKGSFGKGVSLCGYFGYSFKTKLSAELGFSYLDGANYSGSYEKDTSFLQETNVSAFMVRLLPALRITIGEKNLKLYFKIGPVIRLASTINVENSYYDLEYKTETITKWKYTNGLSIGAGTTLGCIKTITEKLNLFCELSLVNQSWAPKNGDVSSHTINGNEMISTLNESQKHTVFVNEYTTQNGKFSTWEPRKQLKQYHPFSSLGLKIGIHYSLSK